ncbi:membrane protein [Pseudoxanthomonas suwonensis]|uniref:membrane protein n=1 Tax=Pseudoxanthomonas suwonensis TaxID=314722 RepID=UPI000463C52D|nr:membrane protein [Pseudoxanthomonas suwonensis]
MFLFFALCFVGVAIAGASAFVIFWPLTLVHIRDRHAGTEADFGPGAFIDPAALRWLLSGGYRSVRDGSLSGLATPARISLFTVIAGLSMAALLWLLAEVA